MPDDLDSDVRRFGIEAIEQFVRTAFVSAGVDRYVARETASGLLTASIRGIDSHGIRLLPHYLEELDAGRINPDPVFTFDRTAPAVGTLDADHTYGIAAGARAMEHAVELAETAGVGHVSVRNSSHNGAMAHFGLIAAREGMIGVATTQTSANTRPPNSTRPFFGSNPICITAPMADEDPFCYDGATSATTFNAVKKYRDDDEELPPGVAADEDGRETRNPHEAVQLLPMGGYKGFGLSMAVDIFNGLLSGMDVGRDVSEMYGDSISETRDLGHYCSAIRIDAFVDQEEFAQRLQDLAEDVRAEPKLNPDEPNYVPGDPEKEATAKRRARGIPVPDHDVERFREIASSLDMDDPLFV